MNDLPRLLDVVAVLRDYPEEGIRRGDTGTVVHEYGDEALEVEFVESDGTTRAMFAIPVDELVPLRFGQRRSVVTGDVGTMWYWYDPNDDVLEVRLQSARGLIGAAELDRDGLAVMRDPSNGRPVGLIVRGFWARFGRGNLDRGGIESRVTEFTPRLAA